jgi:hypothetical protein
VQPCVRSVDAAGLAAGPTALRGSGPKQRGRAEDISADGVYLKGPLDVQAERAVGFCAGDDRQYPRSYGHPGPAITHWTIAVILDYPVSHSEAEKALVEEKP